MNKTQEKITIKLYRSLAGCPMWMRVIVKTIGLRKLNSTVSLNDSPATRGIVKKVPHLLKIVI